ncbi:hypothetical protein GGS20DRAFT_541252 [Poronia punctata]|nr:hypothetical protein GGS20DRAFT_541252 [Poronia punctata]
MSLLTDYQNILEDNNLAGGRNSFQWTVQTYGFDLAFSEKFYLRANNLDDDSDATITPYLYFKAAEEQPISSESPAPSSSVTSSMMTGTSSMSNTMTTSTSTTTATTTSPNSPDKLKPTDSSESGGVRKGLSAGEAAGIGVGVGLGVALAASLASFWYFRKKGRQTPTQLATAISHEPPKSEVHTTTPYAPPAEMSHYTRPVEMHDPLAVPEMPYQSKPAQLGP